MTDFTLNASGSAHTLATGTTQTVTLTGVNAGDLVVVFAACAQDLIDISVSDGTSTLIPCSSSNDINNGGAGNEESIRFFYLLASVASGSVTYTATYSATTLHRVLIATTWVTSGACILDTERNDKYVIAVSSQTTGQIQTTGSDLVLVGQYVTTATSSVTGRTIDGFSPDATIDATVGEMFYKTFGTGFIGEGASTYSVPNNPRIAIASFRIGTVGFGVQTTHQYLYGSNDTSNPTSGQILSVVNSDVNKAVVTIGAADGSSSLWSPTSLTRDGQSFTKIISKDNADFEAVSIWYLDNPHVGTFALTPTWNGGAGAGPAQVGVASACLTQANAGTPTATGTNTATSANPTVTVAGSANGDIVIAALATDLGPTGVTTANAVGFAAIEDIGNDSDFNDQYQYATGASTVSAWTSAAPSSGGWSAAAVAFTRMSGAANQLYYVSA